MGLPTVSPAKVLLLAVHFTAHADIDSLAILVREYPTVLRLELILRILLTHLPETIKPASYVGFLQELVDDELGETPRVEVDTSPINALSDEQASRKVKKLHLLQLSCPEAPTGRYDDPLSLFLFKRAYNLDSETGLLSQLPSLLVPFLHHTPALRIWIASTVLPFLRRNNEYYAETSPAYSLLEFQKLPDRAAVDFLLSHTGLYEDGIRHVGRDLRGIIGPWLHDESRWTQTISRISNLDVSAGISAPGWEQVLEWLVDQASRSWKVAAGAVEQWSGPRDVYLGERLNWSLEMSQQTYLNHTYARAVLASIYAISDPSLDAISGAYRMASKMSWLLHHDPQHASLQQSLSDLPGLLSGENAVPFNTRTATHMRNDLLEASNPLTTPSAESISLITTLALSAYILTQLEIPCTVRKAGDLAFLGDHREQKGELSKLARTISNNAPTDDDGYWLQARRQLLWLHSWGKDVSSGEGAAGAGVLGAVSRQDIDTEILKALLSKSRYALARSLYEDGSDRPLPASTVQDTVYKAALNAFDNASNPNRTRGGLKKCDETIHAFPQTVDKSLASTKRVEALLKATHALSDYRLVLKQGEPFSPVVLRVHSDPISIIGKVLEQNPRAYTRLQEFLEMAINMVHAGLSSRGKTGGRQASTPSTEERDTDISVAEKRIVAMCIEAALREDDFETAYSFVVNRIGSSDAASGGDDEDDWSWSAALKAGQYMRTEKTTRPTHLGTASGNPEIRHLEQRIECLATALRVAPTPQLQEILKTFRRCEEQLDSAVQEEAANEAALDAAADETSGLPGTFDTSRLERQPYAPRNKTATTAARQAEEAPMSLFDLSRATARVAHRNFNVLSSLQGMAGGAGDQSHQQHQSDQPQADDDGQRVRKRDQLREAATGTLVSGVGWLIGANMNRGEHDSE